MEKYEINKYLATFSEQVDDLYQSLNIEKLNNELPILAKRLKIPIYGMILKMLIK